jgi:glycerol-3-phosphate acyltransferase PlsY
MEILLRIACLAVGYVFGLFQTGYIIGKKKKVDIRQVGSGNPGTTNAMRTLGAKAGILTFLGDCIKTILAVVLCRCMVGHLYPELYSSLKYIVGMYAGLGAVLGHNFPFYLNFKGGKGIAASGGFIIAFGVWPMIPMGIVVFFGVVLLTKYVSFGSICLMVSFFIELIVFGQLGWYGVDGALLWEIYVLGFLFMSLAILRHKANIQRLLNGTENKFGVKK